MGLFFKKRLFSDKIGITILLHGGAELILKFVKLIPEKLKILAMLRSKLEIFGKRAF